MSEMKDKMHTGELYLPGNAEIMNEQVVYQDMLCDYNKTKPSESDKRAAMLKKCLAAVGKASTLKRLFMPTSADTTAILVRWSMQIIT